MQSSPQSSPTWSYRCPGHDTRNVSKQPQVPSVRAARSCSQGWASVGLLLRAGTQQFSSSRSIPPGTGEGRETPASPGTNLGWVPLKLVVTGGFAWGSGEAECIYPPLSTCFLTSAASLWAPHGACLYGHGYCTCAGLCCYSGKLPPKWDLFLRNNKSRAGSHTLFIFPVF